MKVTRISQLSLAAALIFARTVGGPAGAQTLWYNGDLLRDSDPNNIGGIRNMGGSDYYLYMYDDFIVDGSGWNVTSVWSNNLVMNDVMHYPHYGPGSATQAFWEIRQGLDAGNGGTFVAGGETVPAVVTATGRSHDEGYYAEFDFRINLGGSGVDLAPGRYWLAVSPYRDGNLFSGDEYYITQTRGYGAIGSPAGNNGSSWEAYPNGTDVGYEDMSNDFGFPLDFSMGVGGTQLGTGPVPEPSALLLLGLGVVIGWVTRKMRFW